MKHFPIKELGYALGFVALLLASYVGAYYALVEPRGQTIETSFSEYVAMRPAYRWGDFLSDDNLFVMMSEIDRKLRPDAWKTLLIFPRPNLPPVFPEAKP